MGESVSFGKYENDGGVCWEKWSTFSPNKYLEEVGKCSTPGSVAEKKAFFEAHYKKIAALKADQLLDNFQHLSLSEEQAHFQSANQEVERLLPSESESESPISNVVDKLEEEPVLVKHFKEPIPQNLPQKKANPTKNLKTSSTKLSKPKATPTKNPNASSSSSENRPTSLHLSMSMNSDTASSSRRPSLFMEQMGDRDIVKRAFKTFQNSSSQPNSKQLPTKGSASSYQKENQRSRKAPHKITPVRGQLGPTWKSVSSGSLKDVGLDERRIKAAPTSVVLKSNERAEKRKEFFKNLEEKSNAREAERIQLTSKSKELKDAEMKKIRQNLSFKAKPMPSFYRTQGLSKSTSEKQEAIKNGTARRPDSHR